MKIETRFDPGDRVRFVGGETKYGDLLRAGRECVVTLVEVECTASTQPHPFNRRERVNVRCDSPQVEGDQRAWTPANDDRSVKQQMFYGIGAADFDPVP